MFFNTDSKGNPRSMTNSKGRKRQVNGKELSAALKTNDALFERENLKYKDHSLQELECSTSAERKEPVFQLTQNKNNT